MTEKEMDQYIMNIKKLGEELEDKLMMIYARWHSDSQKLMNSFSQDPVLKKIRDGEARINSFPRTNEDVMLDQALVSSEVAKIMRAEEEELKLEGKEIPNADNFPSLYELDNKLAALSNDVPTTKEFVTPGVAVEDVNNNSNDLSQLLEIYNEKLSDEENNMKVVMNAGEMESNLGDALLTVEEENEILNRMKNDEEEKTKKNSFLGRILKR